MRYLSKLSVSAPIITESDNIGPSWHGYKRKEKKIDKERKIVGRERNNTREEEWEKEKRKRLNEVKREKRRK